MKKLIYFGPLIIWGYGAFWTTQTFTDASILWCILWGFVLMLFPAIPSFLIAGGAKMFKKKPKEEGKKKSSYWYYFSLYTLILGVAMFAVAGYIHYTK